MSIFLSELHPLSVGASPLLSWLITLLVLVVVVSLAVWLVSKFAGPPNIPEPARWIIWVIAAIALLVFIFAMLGVSI